MSARDYIRDDYGEWVEITDRVNQREPQPLSERAEEGATGFGSIVIDDPAMDLEISPFTQFIRIEDESESEDKVVSAGMLAGRKVVRTTGSSRNPTGRFWVCDFVDANERWHRRIVKGADWDRGEESDNERMVDLLAQMVDWGLIDDDTTYVTEGAESGDLDAEDLRGQYPDDIAGTASERKSKNYWIQRQGDIGSLTDVAWWGRSGNAQYSSPLYLTNDLSVIAERLADIRDGTSDVWPLRMDHGLRCIPERMYSGAYARHRSGAIYRRANGSGALPDTAAIIGVRDVVMAGTEQLTKARAITRAERYLGDMGEEEYRVEGRVRLPRSKVTQLRAGMRVPVAMTHWPFGLDEWTWWRAVTVSPAPAPAGPWWDVDLELASTGDAASGPPEPPYEGDTFASLLSFAGGNNGPSTTFVGSSDSLPGGWSSPSTTGPLTVSTGTSARVTATQAQEVRISVEVHFNTVVSGEPGLATAAVLLNGEVIGSATDSTVGGGAHGFIGQLLIDLNNVLLAAGDELEMRTTPSGFENVGGFGSSGAGPNTSYMLVGRGTHSYAPASAAHFAGTWVGP